MFEVPIKCSLSLQKNLIFNLVVIWLYKINLNRVTLFRLSIIISWLIFQSGVSVNICKCKVGSPCLPEQRIHRPLTKHQSIGHALPCFPEIKRLKQEIEISNA